MNIEQLQYIIEVSELGTIAKAADKASRIPFSYKSSHC